MAVRLARSAVRRGARPLGRSYLPLDPLRVGCTELKQPHAACLAEDPDRELPAASAADIERARRSASGWAETHNAARADVDGIGADIEPVAACFDWRQRRDHTEAGAGEVVLQAPRECEGRVDAVLN